MGNTQEQPNKAIQTGTDKMVLQLRSRSIIIHYGYKFSLVIGDLAMFPHGLSGLKLWESNVVLARFVVMNNALFKGKKVLELGAGTGIGGIAVSKWTKCQSIAMSDSREQVIKNMTKNCERNNINNIVIFRLNLSEYHHFTNKYDILLCSEILRPSPITFQEIYNLFRHFLNPGGSVYIIMSDNIEKIDAFSGLVNSEEFEFKYEKLVDEEYYASPLLNKVEGYKEFERLEQEDYYVVKMKKKEPIEERTIIKKLPELPQTKPIEPIKKEQQKPKQEQPKQQQSPIKAFTKETEVKEENDVCERQLEEQKNQQEAKIKQQVEEEKPIEVQKIQQPVEIPESKDQERLEIKTEQVQQPQQLPAENTEDKRPQALQNKEEEEVQQPCLQQGALDQDRKEQNQHQNQVLKSQLNTQQVTENVEGQKKEQNSQVPIQTHAQQDELTQKISQQEISNQQSIQSTNLQQDYPAASPAQIQSKDQRIIHEQVLPIAESKIEQPLEKSQPTEITQTQPSQPTQTQQKPGTQQQTQENQPEKEQAKPSKNKKNKKRR